MAQVHLKGSAGNDANDSTTWAQALAKVATASGVTGTGNHILADSAQSESSTAAQTLVGGDATDPKYFISGTPDATTGLTAVAKGYTVNITGGTFNAIVTGYAYIQGFIFNCGNSTNNTQFVCAQTAECVQTFKDCDIYLLGNSASSSIQLGSNSSVDGSEVDWDNVNVRFANAAQRLNLNNVTLRWTGGGVASGGTAVTSLFGAGASAGRVARVRMNGVDLSNLGSGFSFLATATGIVHIVGHGLKMPSGWTGVLCSSQTDAGSWRVELYDCDVTNAGHVRFLIGDRTGEAQQETTITRTGSGDGIADFSIKMTGRTEAEFPLRYFACHEQAIWNSVTGSSRTIKVEVAANSALTNKEVVLRVRYYSSTGSPIVTEVRTAPTFIASAAALTTSAASWNGSPSNKYKLELTFTPQRAGYIVWDVLSYTTTPVYVDPLAVLS
jgi:hypothetical protein